MMSIMTTYTMIIRKVVLYSVSFLIIWIVHVDDDCNHDVCYATGDGNNNEDHESDDDSGRNDDSLEIHLHKCSICVISCNERMHMH